MRQEILKQLKNENATPAYIPYACKKGFHILRKNLRWIRIWNCAMQ